MTTAETSVLPRAARVVAPRRWVRWMGWGWMGVDMVLVLGALWALLADRVGLLKEYLFKWTDHDQVLMWAGVREILHGRFHEPCFYGQAYLSMMEAYLAAPLVAWHVPIECAVPIVGVFLGLFPFLVLAGVAFRWRLYLAATVALLIPLVMPYTYAIVSSIPRGFTDGLALAAVAMVVMLPHSPLERKLPLVVRVKRKEWWWRGWRWLLDFVRPKQTAAFLFAGVASGFAVVANPNCGPLLLGVYVYAVLRHCQNWRFWLWTAAGLAPGVLWQRYIHTFYYTLHPEYRMHLRNDNYGWSSDLLTQTLPRVQEFFMNFIPTPNVGVVLLYIAGGLVAALVVVRQYKAAVAAVVATGFVFITLAYERVDRVDLGSASVYYPYSRMYLSVPILAALLVYFVDRGLTGLAVPRWLRGLLEWMCPSGLAGVLRAVVGLVNWTLKGGVVVRRVLVVAVLILAWRGCKYRAAEKEQVLADSVVGTNPLIVRKVQTIYDAAATLRPLLASEHADFVLMYNNDPLLGYGLPALLDCDTLTTSYERRTWLLQEETVPQHERILVYGGTEWVTGPLRAFDPNVRTVSKSPMVVSVATTQRAVIKIAREDLGMSVRNFDPSKEIFQPRFRRRFTPAPN